MRKIFRYSIVIIIIALVVMIWQKAPQSAISMTIALLIAVTAVTFLHKTPDNDLLSAAKIRDVDPGHIQDLISAGASLKSRDVDGRTPLILAASRTASIQALSILIDSGSELEARDNDGNTALITAAMLNPESGIINALLKSGANVNAMNDDGNTALMMSAMFSNNPETLRLLIDAGANVKARNTAGICRSTDGFGC